MKTVIPVTLIPFTDARKYSERNRTNKKKHQIHLSEEESLCLVYYTNMDISDLTPEEKFCYQKISIKDFLYCQINNGKFALNINLKYPLLNETKDWLEQCGYSVNIKHLDPQCYIEDENNKCKFHEGTTESPDTALNYTILW